MHREPVLPGARPETANFAVEESSSLSDTVPALHELPLLSVLPLKVAADVRQTIAAAMSRPNATSSVLVRGPGRVGRSTASSLPLCIMLTGLRRRGSAQLAAGATRACRPGRPTAPTPTTSRGSGGPRAW